VQGRRKLKSGARMSAEVLQMYFGEESYNDVGTKVTAENETLILTMYSTFSWSREKDAHGA